MMLTNVKIIAGIAASIVGAIASGVSAAVGIKKLCAENAEHTIDETVDDETEELEETKEIKDDENNIKIKMK